MKRFYYLFHTISHTNVQQQQPLLKFAKNHSAIFEPISRPCEKSKATDTTHSSKRILFNESNLTHDGALPQHHGRLPKHVSVSYSDGFFGTDFATTATAATATTAATTAETTRFRLLKHKGLFG
jgi:hypothetical protein